MTIGFVHMLPEAVEQYELYAELHDIEDAFPLPFVLMFAGYLLVLFIDRVIMHKLVGHGHHHHGTKEEIECKIKNEGVSQVDAKAD